MSYYICRRTFRDASGSRYLLVYRRAAGIKDLGPFTGRHIVEVNEQTFEKYASLFQQRYGLNTSLKKRPVDDNRAG